MTRTTWWRCGDCLKVQPMLHCSICGTLGVQVQCGCPSCLPGPPIMVKYQDRWICDTHVDNGGTEVV